MDHQSCKDSPFVNVMTQHRGPHECLKAIKWYCNMSLRIRNQQVLFRCKRININRAWAPNCSKLSRSQMTQATGACDPLTHVHITFVQESRMNCVKSAQGLWRIHDLRLTARQDAIATNKNKHHSFNQILYQCISSSTTWEKHGDLYQFFFGISGHTGVRVLMSFTQVTC